MRASWLLRLVTSALVFLSTCVIFRHPNAPRIYCVISSLQSHLNIATAMTSFETASLGPPAELKRRWGAAPDGVVIC